VGRFLDVSKLLEAAVLGIGTDHAHEEQLRCAALTLFVLVEYLDHLLGGVDAVTLILRDEHDTASILYYSFDRLALVILDLFHFGTHALEPVHALLDVAPVAECGGTYDMGIAAVLPVALLKEVMGELVAGEAVSVDDRDLFA
jgi:hypothetical protein